MSSASRASCIDDVVTSATSGSYEAAVVILRGRPSRRHPRFVDEEQGIYRGEVTTMMGVLADINVHVNEILAYIEGDDDDEWEEEEEEEDPS